MADTTAAAIATDAGDNRRAATLTVHYGHGDTAGVNASWRRPSRSTVSRRCTSQC